MHAPRRTSPPSTSLLPFQLQPSSLSLPTASFCCLCVRLPATIATPLAPYDHRRTSLNIKPTRATQHPLDHMIELPTHGSKLGYSFASCSYDLAVPWSEAPGARWTQRQLDTPSPGRGFQLFVLTQRSCNSMTFPPAHCTSLDNRTCAWTVFHHHVPRLQENACRQ